MSRRRSLPFLVLIAEKGKGASLEARLPAIMDQRLLAAVGHPNFLRSRFADGFDEFDPVAMVGDDERQFNALLLGAGADLHPAGRGCGNDLRQRSRPAIRQLGGWAENDFAGEALAVFPGDGRERAKRNAPLFVKLG